MFGPGHHGEIETLAGYLEVQLRAIRTAAFGLTDEQARSTPCRSALSVGGLIKHATYVCDGRFDRRLASPVDQAGVERFLGSFRLGDDETLDSALTTFDTAVDRYLTDVRAADPAAPELEPSAPWDGRFEPSPSVHRFHLVHHIEELARHAGHADILREQLDGASAMSLELAAAGRPGNDFVQPWEPPA